MQEVDIYAGSMLSIVGTPTKMIDERQPKSILWTFWKMVEYTSMPSLGGSPVYLRCIRF